MKNLKKRNQDGVDSFEQLVIAQCKKPTRKWHIWFFPTLKPTLKKPKEPFFCQRTDGQTDRQIDNYSNILYLEKRDIEKYKLNLRLDIFRQQ